MLHVLQAVDWMLDILANEQILKEYFSILIWRICQVP
jgi:hypothetical protein